MLSAPAKPSDGTSIDPEDIAASLALDPAVWDVDASPPSLHMAEIAPSTAVPRGGGITAYGLFPAFIRAQVDGAAIVHTAFIRVEGGAPVPLPAAARHIRVAQDEACATTRERSTTPEGPMPTSSR